MAPRTKKSAGKRPREQSPEADDPQFHIPEHQARCRRLSGLRFGQTRYMDLSLIRSLQLGDTAADEIEDLVSVGSWRQLLTIRDPATRLLTPEVLSSFEYDREDASEFRALGEHFHLSLAQFSIRLGLYEEAYTTTEEYRQLPTDYPGTLTPQQVFGILCGEGQYQSGASQASCLVRPAHRYLHAIFSRSVSGRGDSTGVLSRQELLYLYSMVQGVPIHLGHIVADYIRQDWHHLLRPIHHQIVDRARSHYQY